MKIILHRSDTRGKTDYGWLHSYHSFSFGHYYHPDRMNFGVLRVLNDDVVEPGQGFSTHPHNNMEIISIPLSGSLRHNDSEGNEHIISPGELQIMSAGTGILHSEYNHSVNESVNFLQIWIFPQERNIKPRYGQKGFSWQKTFNKFQTVMSPDERHGALWINQDAYLSLGCFERKQNLIYQGHRVGNGVYFFIIKGKIQILAKESYEENLTLSERDGCGIYEAEKVLFHCLEEVQVLVIEVPIDVVLEQEQDQE